jgi:hypothetical protein
MMSPKELGLSEVLHRATADQQGPMMPRQCPSMAVNRRLRNERLAGEQIPTRRAEWRMSEGEEGALANVPGSLLQYAHVY